MSKSKKIKNTADQIERGLSGQASTLTLPKDLVQWRTDLAKEDPHGPAVSVSAAALGTKDLPGQQAGGNVHSVRTTTGVLSVATYAIKQTFLLRSGGTQQWVAAEEKAVYGSAPTSGILSRDVAVTIAFHTSNDGKVTFGDWWSDRALT